LSWVRRTGQPRWGSRDASRAWPSGDGLRIPTIA
jgi:hypothetical protein